MHLKNNWAIKFICIVAALLLMAYTTYRGIHLSFTHDESLSYLGMVHDKFMDIISNNTSYLSANNHILNTLFMKFSEYLFGTSEISLRLHSLVAHVVFLVFSFLLLKDVKNSVLMCCGYILLNVNPYLLDFFSLARGYALAISLMLVSIYYFLAFLDRPSQRKLVYCLAAACLSCLANFALLNYLAAIVLLYEAYLAYHYRPLKTSSRMLLRKNVPVMIMFVLMLVVCYEPVRKLIKFDALSFGGEKGVWRDTVNSLIDSYLYGYATYVNFLALQILAVATVAGLAILLLVRRINQQEVTRADRNAAVFVFLLTIILLSSAIQHFLWNARFLEARFALFIVPLFVYSLIYFLYLLTLHTRKSRLLVFPLAAVMVIGVIYHFADTFNLTHTYDWKYDADTKKMLTDLQKNADNNPYRKVRLGITWYYERSVNFYIRTMGLTWLEEVDRAYVPGNFDFFYVNKADATYYRTSAYPVVQDYRISNSVLLKNKP